MTVPPPTNKQTVRCASAASTDRGGHAHRGGSSPGSLRSRIGHLARGPSGRCPLRPSLRPLSAPPPLIPPTTGCCVFSTRACAFVPLTLGPSRTMYTFPPLFPTTAPSWRSAGWWPPSLGPGTRPSSADRPPKVSVSGRGSKEEHVRKGGGGGRDRRTLVTPRALDTKSMTGAGKRRRR